MSHNVYAANPRDRASAWARFVCRIKGHSGHYKMRTWMPPVQEECVITFCGRCHKELAYDYPGLTPL